MEPLKRILVVDDDPSITNFVSFVLESQKIYQVRGVNDPIQTLRLARDFRPDLILLDIIMPGMDGGEVAERLGEEPDLSKIPIVFLSAVVSKGDPETVRKQGSNHVYLPKPVEPNDLIRCVKSCFPSAT
jgi:CheY-like chemotaxis protein